MIRGVKWVFLGWLGWVAVVGADEPVRLLAFGSCLKETRQAPTLERVADLRPDVFVWMGDNVYADTEDPEVMRAKYRTVLALPAVERLRETAEVIGTWDDHDYGANDGGKEFPAKVESQQAFLDFLGVAPDDPRRRRAGVHAVHDFGPDGKRVRVILLDTRYHRDPVGSDGTMLGADQWAWLEETLTTSEAEVNVLVSSIQVLPTQHPWEKWSNFPSERERLLALLARPDVPPVVVLSGDRHLAEISRLEGRVGYPLVEVTSSSLNAPLGGRADEPNELRVGENFRWANFGTLSIDWSIEPPVVTACVWDQWGRPQRATSFSASR